MDYIIATHNQKKKNELVRILSPFGIDIHTDSELGIELTDVEETGTTFEENALLKAESGCKESGLPCIADDSGLTVDYLHGAPGVYSARYAGEHGNDALNIEVLLNNLEGVPESKRTAAFVSVICCRYPDGKTIYARGECKGIIGFEPKGDGGFGYDPVFLPEEYGRKLTMAQLTSDQKDTISHRGKALKILASKIGDIK